MNRRLRLAGSQLYLVLEGTPPASVLEAALRGGVDVVQLRDKELSDDELVRAAAPFREACDRHGALFVLNDRPDLVAACSADKSSTASPAEPMRSPWTPVRPTADRLILHVASRR